MYAGQICNSIHIDMHGFCDVCGQYIEGGKIIPGRFRLAGVIVEFDVGDDALSLTRTLYSDSFAFNYGSSTLTVNRNQLFIDGICYGSVSEGDHVRIAPDSVIVNGHAR